MRDWQLNADKPLSLRFAADARAGRTDYIDDQSWELSFGGPQEPALAVQTRYGGRAGFARLVPMFVLDGRSIYESIHFVERPVLRAFAPNYARLTAKLTNALALGIELWVMESQTIGGRFTFENQGSQPAAVRLELYPQAIRNDKSVEMNLLGLDNGSEALHMGRIGNLNPVIMLEKATPQAAGRQYSDRTSPKLAALVNVPAGGSLALKWVHAGKDALNASLQTAYSWLARADWEAGLRKVAALNDSLLSVESANPDLDALLAFSTQVLLRSFVGPTAHLPHPSIVSARIPTRGFSPRSDGTDHGFQWNGQTALSAYLALPSAALLAPDLARGVVRNAIAVQDRDGAIDHKPGLAGQREGALSLPLWATVAWKIYEATEDRAFVAEVYPALRRFFERWFAPDCDQDADGVPEWLNTSQSGYPENPAFARFRRWAQNAEISKVESPDLAAYLVSEGRALLAMAALLGESAAAAPVQTRVEVLIAAVESMWNEAAGSYLYRDRDTNAALQGVHLFRGKGDEAFDVKTPLDPPNRLILRIVGGRDTAPRTNVVIEGLDALGRPLAESVPSSQFAWYYGMGAAVSAHVYSQINYIKFEGIIRLYTVEVDTIDLQRQNLTQLLPLWAGIPDAQRAAQIVRTLTDPARYWRPFGLPVCPANDPAFVANNDGGSGGVWLIWNVMLLEGLLRYGFKDEATTLFNRLIEGQIKALRHDRAFRGGYNSETGDGLGDIDEVEGALPLAVLMRLAGVQIVNPRKVWAGGPFLLPAPVRISGQGVVVMRDSAGAHITFPSGHSLRINGEWQPAEDPAPPPPPSLPESAPEIAVPAAPKPAPSLPEPPIRVTEMPTPRPDSSEGAIIPVQSKKDDTMEIAISQIDYTSSDTLRVEPLDKPSERGPDTPKDDGTTPPTFKVPIRRKDD